MVACILLRLARSKAAEIRDRCKMKRATFQSTVNPVTTHNHLSAFLLLQNNPTRRWKAKTLLARQQHPLKQPKETGELPSAPYVRSGWGAKVSDSIFHCFSRHTHLVCFQNLFLPRKSTTFNSCVGCPWLLMKLFPQLGILFFNAAVQYPCLSLALTNIFTCRKHSSPLLHTNSPQFSNYNISSDCLQSACIQCCTDPTCEPHREAREALRKTQSILDGTDAITRMATQKRNSKVAKGAFKDSNIQYFGETVVIWNIREFMSVTKWREDAVRRSKRKLGGSSVGDVIIGKRGKKRGRPNHCDDDDSNNNTDESAVSLASKRPVKKSRRKKFAEVCQALLQKSLNDERLL